MEDKAKQTMSAGEALWRNAFFYFSALMGALALVDFDAGRFAHGLGDAGVACLMLSLMAQFPFVRALITGGGAPRTRESLMREAERIRSSHPWSDRLASAGWVLLLTSLALRAFGVE